MLPLNYTTILVVDDNRYMRTIHRTILRDLGATVVEAADGEEALKAVEESKPDLILTDYEMPNLSGAEMVGKLRRTKEIGTAATPVVMVTGHAATSRIFAARDAGVDEVCTKPISPAVLWSRLSAAVTKRRPFVVSGVYVGPCRRRRTQDVTVERREPVVLER